MEVSPRVNIIWLAAGWTDRVQSVSRWGQTRPHISCCADLDHLADRRRIDHGPLAQLVEQLAFNQLVAGSNPARPTIILRSLADRQLKLVFRRMIALRGKPCTAFVACDVAR